MVIMNDQLRVYINKTFKNKRVFRSRANEDILRITKSNRAIEYLERAPIIKY